MDFKKIWQFENYLGVIDGKHVAIKQSPGSESYFYNYKGYFRVILFAVVNANYEFIYVSCGTNGRISDGRIIKSNSLMSNSLNIPQPVNMSEIQDKLPCMYWR